MTTTKMILRANCKINLGLDVLRRRDDGYHDLATVMLPVEGLYDDVEIVQSATSSLTIEGIEIDCDAEQNICMKALRLMQQRYGVGQVAITLRKRIPFGAGLGGGSADGTAVILGLNELFELNLNEATLIALAAELGSDTAFFVRNTPQLCEGRGEVMTPVEIDLAGYYLVLIKPDESVSTREAYAGVRPATPERGLVERLSEPIERWLGSIKNDFEESVFATHPVIAAVKRQLLDAGAVYASMSGSGSAVFGIFDSEQRAETMRRLTPYIYKM